MNLSGYIDQSLLPIEIGIGIALLALLLGFIVFLLKRTKRKKLQLQSLFLPKTGFATSLKNLFFDSNKDLKSAIPDLEEILLTADTGVSATESLIKKLSEQKDIQTKAQAYDFIKSEIKNRLTPKTEFKINTENKPFVIYLVGVNGVGKTTSIGKLAHQFKAQGHQVMLVAADTFRAAAVEQLRIWAERNQVGFFGGNPEADPASVIIDGLRSAKSKNMDIVLVDTAGRLHTKHNLMAELQKMTRMSEKELGKTPDEIFLIVDAITGQNGFAQAQVFLDAVPLTGVILTKYDATSKGGIIISIVEKTGLPIRYVGLGEKIEDLKKFDPNDFVNKIF